MLKVIPKEFFLILCSCAEDGGSDSDEGGPGCDGTIEIGAHSEAEYGELELSGDACTEEEVFFWLVVEGRYTHDSLNIEFILQGEFEEFWEFFWIDSGFLGFLSCIDLYEDGGIFFELALCFCEGVYEGGSIESVDEVEEFEGLFGFIGLQGSDEV